MEAEGAKDARTTTETLVHAVGDGAPLVIVLHDQAWGETRERIPQFLSPPVIGAAGALVDAEDGADFVWGMTPRLELPQALPRPQWEGRDTSRPIVVSAYEAPVDGPPGVATAGLVSLELAMPPMRHQVVVPATDRDALMASLEQWWSASSRPAPALVEGLPGAVGLELSPRAPFQSFVALVPEEEHVRMVVLHEGRGIRDAGELRSHLDVDEHPRVDTPAMRHALDERHAAAALVRPWRLRATGVWIGLYYMGQAADFVEAKDRPSIIAKGASIAATVDVATPDDLAEFDDWSVGVSSDAAGLQMTVVASLTPRGRELWGAFAANPGVVAPRRPDVDLALALAGDLAGTLERAQAHDLHGMRPGQLAEVFYDCGDTCPAFAALRWPMAAMKTLSPGVVADGFGVDALHLVVPSVDQTGGMAVAMTGAQLPASEVVEAVMRDMGGQGAFRSSSEPIGGRPALVVSQGVDPAAAFDLSAEGAAPDALMSLWMRGEGLGRALTQSNPVEARVRTAGPALTLEVVVGDREPSFAPDYSEAQWDPPMGSAPASRAATCLHSLALEFNQSVGAVVAFHPADRGAVARKHVAAMRNWVACAAKDPALGAAAKQLADTAAVLMARFLVSEREASTARAVLQSRCPDGGRDGAACQELMLLEGVD
ncbi:MAG: hypothetical protein AAF799_19680 [Myxococcota bacterium]